MLEEIVEMERPISDINDMTKQELRVELKKRGLSTSGIKSALVGRLKEAEEFVRTSPVKYFTIDFENDINKLPSMIALLHPYMKQRRYHRGHENELHSSDEEPDEKAGLMNSIEKSEQQMVDSYVDIVNKYERAIAIIDNNNILIVESDEKEVDNEISSSGINSDVVNGDVDVNLCKSAAKTTVDEEKISAADVVATVETDNPKFGEQRSNDDGPVEIDEFADALGDENGKANGCASVIAGDCNNAGADDEENHRVDNDSSSVSIDDDDKEMSAVPEEEEVQPIEPCVAGKRKRSECDYSDETESSLSDASVEPCRDSNSCGGSGNTDTAGEDTPAATETPTTVEDDAAYVKKRKTACSPDGTELSARKSSSTDDTSGGPSADGGKDGDLRKQRSNKRKKSSSSNIDDIIARTLPPLKDVETQNAELSTIESPDDRLVYLEELVKTLREQYMSMKKKIKIIDDRMKKMKGRSQQSDKNV